MHRDIFVIGTLHLRLTPLDELQEVLETLKPDQLFVELPPEHSSVRAEAERTSDEMVFATTWAKEQGIPVVSFDTEEDMLKEGIDTENEAFVRFLEQEIEDIKRIPWKERNKKEHAEDTKRSVFRERFIDEEKWQTREQQMLENITGTLADSGTAVILTGAGHLDFFEEHMPEGILYFRD